MSELKGDFNAVVALGGAIHVKDFNGDTVASFSDQAAYTVFKQGLITYGNLSLYDVDKQQFLVGDVGQLVREA